MTDTKVPVELVAGDTWTWTRELSDFPAGTWIATVYFENSDETFSAVATASGLAHSFLILASTSTTYKPGRYGWRLRVTDGTTTTTVESGITEVLVDPAKSGTVDTRSWARRTLEAVEAFLENNATTAQASMSIQGRSISRWALPDLIDWRNKLKAEVTAEDSKAKGRGRDIRVRFVR